MLTKQQRSKASRLRSDPSNTFMLRKRFEREAIKRFNRIKSALIDLVQREDAFGLKGLVANTRWKFRTNPAKVEEFRLWLQKKSEENILERPSADDPDKWWDQYMLEAYQKGQLNSFESVNKQKLGESQDFYKGTKEQFLRDSFAQPETKEKVQLLASRVFTDLKGVTEAMSSAMTRTLVDGLSQGQNPFTIARQMVKDVDGVGINRARAIARTECLPGDTLVDSAVVRAIFRRWYVGDMVEIVTRSGRKFSATPNHPMLTQDGWIFAGKLEQGNNLISNRWKENHSLSRDPNENGSPSTLSEIFSSVSRVGNLERVIGRKPDFHGDGRESQVDILCPNGTLKIGNFSPIGEPIVEDVFTPTGKASSSLCSECGRLLSIDQQSCLCHSACQDSIVYQPSFDGVPIAVELFSQQTERFSSGIATDNLIHAVANVCSELISNPTSFPRVELSFGEISGDSSPSEDLSNLFLIRPDLFGNLPLSQSTEIELDEIVLKTVRPFSGHVYNLETPYGYYTIQGYYTGNTLRAHNEGQLDSLEALGVEEVGVAVEWSDAADGRVCPLCSAMAGVVLKVKEAHGMLPRHVNCRCCWTVANVMESKKGQIRSKSGIDGAFEKSITREIPKGSKRTYAEQKEKTSWAGADTKIAKKRPKSILD